MLLKRSNYNLNMAHTETDADVLNSIDSTSTNPIPVIYQSGYQTIKDYDRLFGIFTGWDFPTAKRKMDL